MAKYGEFKYGEAKYGRSSGYVLLLRAGSAPQAGVDTPVATLPDSADTAVLDMTTLALLANTDYKGAVVPFNESGFGQPPATFSLRTDVTGKPSLAPAAVTNLRAEALAGGMVRVEWEYDEPNPLALAETFQVARGSGGVIGVVAYTPHQRRYAYTHLAVFDGLDSVTVTTLRSFAGSEPVSVAFRSDAMPPAATPLAISAA